ncbi:transposase [Escherichia coli]|nr:transposase [Escherichia coli]
MTDFGGKTSIFSHPVYLFLREFSLQDFRGGSVQPVANFIHFINRLFKDIFLFFTA